MAWVLNELGGILPLALLERHTWQMSSSSRPRVYLAGPDVFRPDAAHYFALLAAACERIGLQALAPFDESITPTTSPHSIYASNIAMLRSADGVVANLAPFRGAEPDSGTVFEVGAAVALGLPVIGYGLPPGDYAARVPSAQRDDKGMLRDADGLAVEDFGLSMNLMLARSVMVASTAEEALQLVARAIAERR